MSSLQSCITFTLALPLQAAPLGAFAPTVTVFPTSELLNNALCLDFQHCYGASINPVQYAEMDNKKLRGCSLPSPFPNYAHEEYLASGTDKNLMEKSGTPAMSIVLQPMFMDKTDVEFPETSMLNSFVPEEVY